MMRSIALISVVQSELPNSWPWLAGIITACGVAAFLVARQFRRCPSNYVLVVYGRGLGPAGFWCAHGGGRFVIPLLQDYTFLCLDPMVVQVSLDGITKDGFEIAATGTFTVGINTRRSLLHKAVERFVHTPIDEIRNLAEPLLRESLRESLPRFSLKEFNRRETPVSKHVFDRAAAEVASIGLEVINVNINARQAGT